MTFKLIWERRRVTIRYAGPTSDRQSALANRLIHRDPRSDDLREIVHDCRDSTSYTYYRTTVEELAAIDGASALSNPHPRIAVLAVLPEIIAATDYYAELGLSPFPVRVFADPAAADAWLRA